MINIKATDGENSLELSGKALLAIIIEPTNKVNNSNSASMVLGRGTSQEILGASAACIGALVNQMESDPMLRTRLIVEMLERMKEAALGRGMQSIVTEKKIRPAKKEDE